MTSPLERTRVAGELGERLAGGDETAIEDIQSVIAPIIRAGDELEGIDIIMQIIFGMLPPAVFDAMYDRHLQRIRQLAENPLLAMRDQTEAATIRSILAPTKRRADEARS